MTPAQATRQARKHGLPAGRIMQLAAWHAQPLANRARRLSLTLTEPGAERWERHNRLALAVLYRAQFNTAKVLP